MPGPLPPANDDNKLPTAPDAPPGGGKPVKFPSQGQPPPRAPGLPPGYSGPDDEDDS